MITFTPEAYAELSWLVSELGDRKHVVMLLWLEASLDLVRSDEGKAVWKEVIPARWHVSVEALPGEKYETEEERRWSEHYVKWLEETLVLVGDLRVHFSPSKSGATHVTVTYVDGNFDVQQTA